MRRLWMLLLPACLSVYLPGALATEEEPTTDRVSFQVDVGREVENDRVLAVLSITAEHKNPATLADTINSTMSWALEQARANHKVKPRSGGYQTYPVYDDKKIVRWRGRQELQLESQDVDQLSQLVGILQSRLQMQSLQFSVSPEKRRQVEEQLIQEALAAYQKRAAVVQQALGATGYELLDVTINTDGRPPVVPVRAEAMVSRAQVTPPAMEGGTSRVTVKVTGSVRLLRN